jgi:hypothetical protein
MSLVEATKIQPTTSDSNHPTVGMQNRHDGTMIMIADAAETIIVTITVIMVVLIHDVITRHGETVDDIMTMANHTTTPDATIANLLLTPTLMLTVLTLLTHRCGNWHLAKWFKAKSFAWKPTVPLSSLEITNVVWFTFRN